MKINCPHCHCAYDLEPVKMPAPKYNAMQESWGWKFECGACDHQWWLKLINAEGLSASQREVADDVNMELRFFDNRYNDSHSKFYDKQKIYVEPHTEKIKNLPMVAPKRGTEQSKRLVAPPLPRQNIDNFLNQQQAAPGGSTFFWVSVALLFIILVSIIYTYRDVFEQKLNSFLLNQSLQVSAMSLPLDIKNVHWDKAVMPDGSVKVAVIGEVQNHNQTISRLRSLHMSAWGPCDPADKTSPRCMLGGFMYDFQKPTIVPEERLSFQASWLLPKAVVVTDIDVRLP